MNTPTANETTEPEVLSETTGNRLVRWFTYNLFYAFFPLIASLSIHGLAGKFTFVAFVNSPEILFFALMVGATAGGDLSEISPPLERDLQFRILKSFLQYGTAFSALFYGVFIYDGIINPNSLTFRSNLLLVSVGLAVVLFIVGTVVEVMLGRIEK